jgi:transcriptional regulator GlxA family with amidase domain
MIRPVAKPRGVCRTFVFLLVDGFSMMSLASAIEPLRSFNRLIGEEKFAWRLARVGAGPVYASNGLAFETQPVSEAITGAEILFVCGGLRIKLPNERSYHAALRAAARLGLALGSLSTGGSLLASAGLLKGYRCTIHWENRQAFLEEFPDINCTDKIYEIDNDRLTCSGGTAAMDLMLRLIGDEYGHGIALRVADQFHHDRIRNEEEEQRGCRSDRRNSLPPLLQTAISLMETHIESPVDIAAIADEIGLSIRQLQRLFLQHTATTPARFYVTLRIERARQMLLYSNISTLEISIAAGFSSMSHFSHWFKQVYGQTPTAFRQLQTHGAANVAGHRGERQTDPMEGASSRR